MALEGREPRRRASDWELSSEAFSRLLAALGPDAATAGERYERIRAKLGRIFEWRGCTDPGELVDRTFDRVARRLEEGVELTVADPYAYVHGVAMHVLQEHWREAARRSPLAEDVALPGEVHDEAEGDTSRRLSCLDECLRSLPAGARRLLERYHATADAARIGQRQALAAELGITLNALRIQAFRLRERTQGCISRCAAAPPQAKGIVRLRTPSREGARR
jgi:DNA-directed RNA polymerase specialized sigma24 family protein